MNAREHDELLRKKYQSSRAASGEGGVKAPRWMLALVALGIAVGLGFIVYFVMHAG